MRSDSLGIWRDSEGRGWRGGEVTPSPLCVRNAVTHATLGWVAQGPNRHGYCTQPLPSRRQDHERFWTLEGLLSSILVRPSRLPHQPGTISSFRGVREKIWHGWRVRRAGAGRRKPVDRVERARRGRHTAHRRGPRARRRAWQLEDGQGTPGVASLPHAPDSRSAAPAGELRGVPAAPVAGHPHRHVSYWPPARGASCPFANSAIFLPQHHRGRTRTSLLRSSSEQRDTAGRAHAAA